MKRKKKQPGNCSAMSHTRSTSWSAFLVMVMITVTLAGCHILGPMFVRTGMKPAPAGQSAVSRQTAGNLPNNQGLSVSGPTSGGNITGEAVPDLDPNRVPAPRLTGTTEQTSSVPIKLSGRLVPGMNANRTVQAVSADVIKDATVTLLGTGNQTIATGLTDAAGNFTLTLASFQPSDLGTYVLEVGKGLATGAPGTPVARFRTIVQWVNSEGGWRSLTNDQVGGAIVVNALTTAVAIEIALDGGVAATSAIGKVDASVTPAIIRAGSPPLTNHPDQEIRDLAADLTSYLTNDFDPVAAVNAIKPTLLIAEPAFGFPGALVKIRGNGFSPVTGGNIVRFGTTTAPVYVATPTFLIVGIPAGATTNDLTVTTTRGGTSNGLAFTVTNGLPVAIQTNGIDAPYYVAGAELTTQRGNRTVYLYPGTAQIVFSTGQSATFVLAQDGTVDASTANGVLGGGANLVSFYTVTLTIDPGSYAGNYIISGSFQPAYVIGGTTVKLLRGLAGYQLIAGSPHLFDVNSDGTVSPRGSWAQGGSQLTFSNLALTVQANSYTGSWSINNVTPASQTGTVAVALPKDSKGYVFNVMGTSFTFDMDNLGSVTTSGSPYATGGTQVITLQMITLSMESNGYLGQYSLVGLTGWVSGNQDIVLMKSFAYRVSFWPGNSYIAFKVGSDGSIALQNAGGQASTDALSVPGIGRLAFNTTQITVNSQQWAGNYGILYGQKAGSWTWAPSNSTKPNWVRGDDSFTLLLGMTNYYFLYFYPGDYRTL
ncbi:MAG: hypothetical protein HY692_04630, partial [Cyanobacteria bacterium NC_groundwater_1444_Ag_S-0.65um_54_12]|nr:hypothetical protein [Cyanobacteria bacterium NC_groundwater_1444_Ag_S-0.65um_54_12]